MGSADNRLRLPALNVEFQSFIPIKEQIKFNLFMYGEAGTYTSSKRVMHMMLLLKTLLRCSPSLMFRIADGYTPKSKMASTDFLTTLLQNILSSPVLAQSPYVQYVPGMVAHIAQLAGVHNFSEYAPPEMTQPSQQRELLMDQLLPHEKLFEVGFIALYEEDILAKKVVCLRTTG